MLFFAYFFSLYNDYLISKVLGGFRDFKIGQVIRTVKYGDFLLLAEKLCHMARLVDQLKM
jgi:hypothetical protein